MMKYRDCVWVWLHRCWMFLFVLLSQMLPHQVSAEAENNAFQLLPDSSNFVTVTKTGERRAMLTGKTETLVEAKVMPMPSVITPMWAFGCLLVLAVLITLLQHTCKMSFIPHAFDVLLLSGQTALGLLLLFVTFYSELFGSSWNWYLIVFNPIPALLWLCCRKRSWYRHVWGVYAMVLVFFLLATPLLPVLDAPHQFITATLLIRCVNQIFINHKQKF